MLKVCRVCSIEFSKPPNLSYVAWAKRLFCSRVCSAQGNPGNFKKNVSSWNKGKKATYETRAKISAAQIGRKKSETTKDKQRQRMLGRSITWGDKIGATNRIRMTARTGPLANNWRGGRTSEAKLIRSSIAYKNWRTTVFERDDYTCQICFSRGGELNADHIKPFARYPDLRLELSNGRTLCVSCHKKTPTYMGRGRWATC